MGYRAYHKKVRYIKRGENKEWDKLIPEGKQHVRLEDTDFIVGLDTFDRAHAVTPYDLLSFLMNDQLNHSYDSDEFCCGKGVLEGIREDIADSFKPEDEGYGEVMGKLDSLIAYAKEDGDCDFICY